MRKLAEKICTFMCGTDLYEAKDCYDSLENFITETTKSLWLSAQRKAIAERLKEIVEEHDDEETAQEAYELYVEVMAI